MNLLVLLLDFIKRAVWCLRRCLMKPLHAAFWMWWRNHEWKQIKRSVALNIDNNWEHHVFRESDSVLFISSHPSPQPFGSERNRECLYECLIWGEMNQHKPDPCRTVARLALLHIADKIQPMSTFPLTNLEQFLTKTRVIWVSWFHQERQKISSICLWPAS